MLNLVFLLKHAGNFLPTILEIKYEFNLINILLFLYISLKNSFLISKKCEIKYSLRYKEPVLSNIFLICIQGIKIRGNENAKV